MDYIAKYLLPILALGISVWAIVEARLARGTAKDALQENKRQHTTGLRPSMSIKVETERHSPSDYSSVVYVCNDGPGAAQNIVYELDISWPEHGQWPGQHDSRRVGGLTSGGRHKVTELRHSGVKAWGTVTAEDVEGRPYWWRQPQGDAPTQSGTGPLPAEG